MIYKKIVLLGTFTLVSNSLNGMLKEDLLLLHAQLTALNKTLPERASSAATPTSTPTPAAPQPQQATPSSAAPIVQPTPTPAAAADTKISAETKAASASSATQTLSQEERKKIIDYLNTQVQEIENIRTGKSGEATGGVRIALPVMNLIVERGNNIIAQFNLVQNKFLMPFDEYLARTYIATIDKTKSFQGRDADKFIDEYQSFYYTARRLVFLLSNALNSPQTWKSYWEKMATIWSEKGKNVYMENSEQKLIDAKLLGSPIFTKEQNYIASATELHKPYVHTMSIIINYLETLPSNLILPERLQELKKTYKLTIELVKAKKDDATIIPNIQAFYKEASKVAQELSTKTQPGDSSSTSAPAPASVSTPAASAPQESPSAAAPVAPTVPSAPSSISTPTPAAAAQPQQAAPTPAVETKTAGDVKAASADTTTQTLPAEEQKKIINNLTAGLNEIEKIKKEAAVSGLSGLKWNKIIEQTEKIISQYNDLVKNNLIMPYYEYVAQQLIQEINQYIQKWRQDKDQPDFNRFNRQTTILVRLIETALETKEKTPKQFWENMAAIWVEKGKGIFIAPKERTLIDAKLLGSKAYDDNVNYMNIAAIEGNTYLHTPTIIMGYLKTLVTSGKISEANLRELTQKYDALRALAKGRGWQGKSDALQIIQAFYQAASKVAQELAKANIQ